MTTLEMRKALRRGGFQHSLVARYGPTTLTVAVVVFTLLAWRYAERMSDEKVKAGDAAGGILALGAFVVAYQQWRAARMEASMDKYYDRLDLANRRIEVLPNVDKYDMYVFTELDNLEYMLERYRLGYARTANAFRCLQSFRSRCRDEGFRSKAAHWVAEAGYQETTRNVVDRIND